MITWNFGQFIYLIFILIFILVFGVRRYIFKCCYVYILSIPSQTRFIQRKSFFVLKLITLIEISCNTRGSQKVMIFNIIVIIRPLIFRMTGLWVVLLTYSDPVPCKCAPNPDIQQIKIQKHLTRIMSLHNLAFEFRE